MTKQKYNDYIVKLFRNLYIQYPDLQKQYFENPLLKFLFSAVEEELKTRNWYTTAKYLDFIQVIDNNHEFKPGIIAYNNDDDKLFKFYLDASNNIIKIWTT